jgi:hypothetical protein
LFDKKDTRIAAKTLKVLQMRSSASFVPRNAKSGLLESKKFRQNSESCDTRTRGDIVSGRESGPARLRQVILDGYTWEVRSFFVIAGAG